MSSSECTSFCKLSENWCDTDICLHEVKYVWTINNFNFQEAIGADLNSPTFSSATNPQVKWFLRVKPNVKIDSTDVISFFVCLDFESNPKTIFAKYSASVLDRRRKEKHRTKDIPDAPIREFNVVSRQQYKSWGKIKFLEKNNKFRNKILVDQKLTIICRIIFSAVSESFPVSNVYHHCDVTPLYPELPKCNLAENFGMLLESREFSDVVLCVNENEYPAHKLVLAARSSVFAAMFKHNLKENETNRIEIEDMNEEVVAEMLRYIYTGKCENCENFADGLLAAADKYDMIRLKMICAESLYKTLSVDNAANVLALADLHGVQELKSEAIKFIVIRFSEVVMSTAWKNMLVSNPKLIDEVCIAVAGRPKKRNQESSFESKRSRTDDE